MVRRYYSPLNLFLTAALVDPEVSGKARIHLPPGIDHILRNTSPASRVAPRHVNGATNLRPCLGESPEYTNRKAPLAREGAWNGGPSKVTTQNPHEGSNRTGARRELRNCILRIRFLELRPFLDIIPSPILPGSFFLGETVFYLVPVLQSSSSPRV